MKNTFQVTIIGGGPGGYVAAIRAAQLGLKVALIEKYNALGGTCLNVGCIPSKALLDSTEHYHKATKEFADHGIQINKPKIDMKTLMARKQSVIDANTAGIKYLMGKNKITVFHGIGTIKDKQTITVEGKDKNVITTEKIIIATGSKPATLPFIKLDKKRVITSTEALSLKSVPKSMIVLGGGVIGMELGSVYARLGTKVTVVEYLDKIILGMDDGMGKELQKSLKTLGFDFYLSTKAVEVKAGKSKVVLKAENVKDGKKIELNADYCLVSIGRTPYTQGLGLENVGIETDKQGKIPVDDHLQTKVSNIWAIGDVVKGVMLAHKAEEEGVFVAEQLVGQKPHINYNLIPSVVYTWPEVASVGDTEAELKNKNIAYKTGKFPYKALGRARASMDLDGFVKVLAHKDTDEILGVHIIGARAADMIASAVTAMEFRASAEDIARTSHAHPTYMEAFKEACLDATEKRAIHI